jgi:hypothetical protein
MRTELEQDVAALQALRVRANDIDRAEVWPTTSLGKQGYPFGYPHPQPERWGRFAWANTAAGHELATAAAVLARK